MTGNFPRANNNIYNIITCTRIIRYAGRNSTAGIMFHVKHETAGKHKLDNHAPDIYNNTRVILYILYITRLYIIYANLHRPESARAICKNFLLSTLVKNFYLPTDLLPSCKDFFITAHTAYII